MILLDILKILQKSLENRAAPGFFHNSQSEHQDLPLQAKVSGLQTAQRPTSHSKPTNGLASSPSVVAPKVTSSTTRGGLKICQSMSE